ncbi:hypothetical protein TRVL_07911 [Trypanosoma vivax]|nr:hypothetical protein TRVL_07911 [Trypanosoma vivax]
MKRTENELSLDSSTSRVIHSASRKSVARGRRDLMDSVGAPPVGGASASGSVMKGSMQSHRDSLTSQNCREENFDSILGHIVKGYRQINPKGCNPCRGHDTFERASGVTCLVNHAVDSCVPRETSASLTDSYSNLSVLTSNCDHYFEKRLSFNTRSEFTDVEDESEINLKTNVLMGLATFDEKNAEVSVSVSCPIKMIALPFTFSGTAKAPEMPKGTAISASRTLASFSMTLSSSLLQAGDVEWDEAHGGADSDVTLKSAVELLSISSGCDCLRMNYTGSSLSTTCGDLVAAMK